MRGIKFRAFVKDTSLGKYFGMFYGVERAYDTLGYMLDSKGEEIKGNIYENLDLLK